MERLKEVTEKICELLKGSELEFTMCDKLSTDFNGNLFRPIREAEILMALYFDINIFKSKTYITACDVLHTETISRKYNIPWQLGKPLSEQSKETIEFLHKILVR